MSGGVHTCKRRLNIILPVSLRTYLCPLSQGRGSEGSVNAECSCVGDIGDNRCHLANCELYIETLRLVLHCLGPHVDLILFHSCPPPASPDVPSPAFGSPSFLPTPTTLPTIHVLIISPRTNVTGLFLPLFYPNRHPLASILPH